MKIKHLILIIFSFVTVVYSISQDMTGIAELPSEVYGKSIGIGNDLQSLSDNPVNSGTIASRNWRPDPEDGDESGGGENAPGSPVGNGIFVMLILVSGYIIVQKRRLNIKVKTKMQ